MIPVEMPMAPRTMPTAHIQNTNMSLLHRSQGIGRCNIELRPELFG